MQRSRTLYDKVVETIASLTCPRHTAGPANGQEFRMPSMHRYQLPVEQTGWRFNGQSEIDFAWEYDAPRERLLKLYGKAKKDQWDQATRIDWSTDLDPENPMQLDDRISRSNGTEMWEKLTPKRRPRAPPRAGLEHFPADAR